MMMRSAMLCLLKMCCFVHSITKCSRFEQMLKYLQSRPRVVSFVLQNEMKDKKVFCPKILVI